MSWMLVSGVTVTTEVVMMSRARMPVSIASFARLPVADRAAMIRKAGLGKHCIDPGQAWPKIVAAGRKPRFSAA
jgi:hypothetical protein